MRERWGDVGLAFVRARRQGVAGGLGAAIAVLLTSGAFGATSVLVPIADGELSDDPRDGVFDTIDATDVAIDLESIASQNVLRRGALEFDLTAIPVGATITSATLRLTQFGGGTAPSRIDVHGYVADGSIDLGDAEASNTLAGQTFYSSVPAFVVVDVTGYVESLVSRGVPTLGLSLRTDESSANARLRFGASELASDPPELMIEWDVSGPAVPPHIWRWLPVLEDGYATDDPTDGTFDTITTTGSSLRAHSQVTQFLSIFITRRAMLEFDLAMLPGAPILAATLELDASQLSTSGGSADFELYGYEGDGVVELADADAGAALVDTVTLSSTTPPVRFDVASYLTTLQGSQAAVAGFNLRSARDGMSGGNGHDDEVTVGSRESTSIVRLPPRLIVESAASTPVPSGGAVWTAGAVGLLVACAARHLRRVRRRAPA
ncbi:MAG: DNRLRE domain-containing protein [Myxococcota bacterium]